MNRLYNLRNNLWKAGYDLLDNSKSIREKRMGQLLVDLGYLIAYEYEKETLDYDRLNEVPDNIREMVRFALTVKF